MSSLPENSKSILLEDFHNPTNKWTTLNDPVMGGKSYSNVEIDHDNGIAKFTGKCAIVPSLQAPGFITMETGGQFGERPSVFPDISTCSAFQFELKTNVEYSGYRFSFGKAHAKGGRFAYGYKVPLQLDQDLPPVGEFGTVTIPFHKFSDKWDDATGDIIVPCEDDPQYCPTEQWLRTPETMSFWGEGVEGMIDLEIKTISAVGCDADASEVPVTPSAIKSKLHTINSNPFYFAVVTLLVVIVTLVMVSCCSCYFCCNRRSRRADKMQRSRSASDPLDAYKDDPSSSETFEDEVDDVDIELS